MVAKQQMSPPAMRVSWPEWETRGEDVHDAADHEEGVFVVDVRKGLRRERRVVDAEERQELVPAGLHVEGEECWSK